MNLFKGYAVLGNHAFLFVHLRPYAQITLCRVRYINRGSSESLARRELNLGRKSSMQLTLQDVLMPNAVNYAKTLLANELSRLNLSAGSFPASRAQHIKTRNLPSVSGNYGNRITHRQKCSKLSNARATISKSASFHACVRRKACSCEQPTRAMVVLCQPRETGPNLNLPTIKLTQPFPGPVLKNTRPRAYQMQSRSLHFRPKS